VSADKDKFNYCIARYWNGKDGRLCVSTLKRTQNIKATRLLRLMLDTVTVLW